MAIINGTSSSDTLTGTGEADRIFGLNGQDTLSGGDGDDYLDGGSNDDRLTGGAGNDVFAFVDRAVGDDTITDFAAGDRIDLSAFNIGDLATLTPFMRQSGLNVVITFGFGGGSETITIANTQLSALTASSFIFNTAATALTVNGTSSTDVLFGGNGDDQIRGLNGQDTLSGGDGDDYLDGGSNDDRLTGGAGNDVFAFVDRAVGDDTITDFAAGDRIDLSAFNIGDLATLTPFMRQSGLNVVITFGFGGGSETITIANTQLSALTASSFIFNTAATALTVNGTSSTDVLFGGNGDDQIRGGNGQDTLTGGAGADYLDGGAGTDLAQFSGRRADYRVTEIEGGLLIESDREGSDRLVNIERFGFADGVFDLAGVLQPPPPPSPPQGPDNFVLAMTPGASAVVEGIGQVFGDFGFQDVVIADAPSRLTLDASFNQGGDRVVLSGNASTWTARRTGSAVELSDGDTLLIVPGGLGRTDLVFADGVRGLRFDEAAGRFVIGSQAIETTAAAITAAVQTATVTDTVDAAAPSYLALFAGGAATAGGRLIVFGTAESAETVALRAGSVAELDPSFNAGGDTIILPGESDGYSAARAGSSVVISGEGGRFTVPIGTAGALIRFDDSSGLLRFDEASQTVRLGDTVIGTAPVTLASGTAPADFATFIV